MQDIQGKKLGEGFVEPNDGTVCVREVQLQKDWDI